MLIFFINGCISRNRQSSFILLIFKLPEIARFRLMLPTEGRAINRSG